VPTLPDPWKPLGPGAWTAPVGTPLPTEPGGIEVYGQAQELDPYPGEWPPADDPAVGVLAALEDIIDVPPITAPQAQGDVLVLPWIPATAPAMRAERIAETALVPYDGVAVTPDRSHVLLPEGMTAASDGSGPRIRYADVHKGNTLGTLVVEDGAAARLSHREHPDLLIGPGVYVLHSQRRWTPTTPAAVPD
jgi:hypothetical protein